MLSIIDGKYVVQIPEDAVYQDMDPTTGGPFASEAKAQAWVDDYIATKATRQAAEAAAALAAKRAERHLQLTSSSATAMVGANVTLTAHLRDGLGQLVALNETLAVPVELNGQVVRIKGLALTGGEGSTTIAFSASGVYRISSEGINSQRAPEARLQLAQAVQITVME